MLSDKQEADAVQRRQRKPFEITILRPSGVLDPKHFAWIDLDGTLAGPAHGPPAGWLHEENAFLVALAHGLSGPTTLRSATCSFSDARVNDLTSSAESKARSMSSRATARRNLRGASACSRWRRNMIECCSILRSSHKIRRHFRQLQQLHQVIMGLGALAP
jgi:hypothetical protein